MKKTIIILVLFNSIILSQKYSVGFTHSRLIDGKNYTSALEYSIGGEYAVLKDVLSLGISTSFILAKNNHLVKNPPASVITEKSLSLALSAKYHPINLLIKDSFSLKPFLGMGIGGFLINGFSIPGQDCEVSQFKLSLEKYFFSYFSFGVILFPDKLNFILDVKYLIRNPEINYKVPTCYFDKETTYTSFTETADMSLFLWSLGVRVNF